MYKWTLSTLTLKYRKAPKAKKMKRKLKTQALVIFLSRRLGSKGPVSAKNKVLGFVKVKDWNKDAPLHPFPHKVKTYI